MPPLDSPEFVARAPCCWKPWTVWSAPGASSAARAARLGSAPSMAAIRRQAYADCALDRREFLDACRRRRRFIYSLSKASHGSTPINTDQRRVCHGVHRARRETGKRSSLFPLLFLRGLCGQFSSCPCLSVFIGGGTFQGNEAVTDRGDCQRDCQRRPVRAR